MTKTELERRVEELERELAELKAAPKVEQHFHYHYTHPPQIYTYPTYPLYPTTQPYWNVCSTTASAGTYRTYTLMNSEETL